MENELKKKIRKDRKKAKLEKKNAIVQLPEFDNRYSIYNCSALELIDKYDEESIDWIITDPPYPKQFLNTFSDLSLLASKVLKKNGGLIVMSGQHYLPEVITKLSAHMEYHWTCAYLTLGGQAPFNFQRKVNPFWKPILIYKRKDACWQESFGDVIKTTSNNNDKNHHYWGQSVEGFDDLVKRFTYPGQTILDPFVGGGTTAISALANDRLFVGCDISKEFTDKTLERIQDLKSVRGAI